MVKYRISIRVSSEKQANDSIGEKSSRIESSCRLALLLAQTRCFPVFPTKTLAIPALCLLGDKLHGNRQSRLQKHNVRLPLVKPFQFAEVDLLEPFAPAPAFMISNIFIMFEGRSFGPRIISTHCECFVSGTQFEAIIGKARKHGFRLPEDM